MADFEYLEHRRSAGKLALGVIFAELGLALRWLPQDGVGWASISVTLGGFMLLAAVRGSVTVSRTVWRINSLTCRDGRTVRRLARLQVLTAAAAMLILAAGPLVALSPAQVAAALGLSVALVAIGLVAFAAYLRVWRRLGSHTTGLVVMAAAE